MFGQFVTELLGESSNSSTTEVPCDTPSYKDSDAEDTEPQPEIFTSPDDKQAAPITSTVKVQTARIKLRTTETQTDPPAPQSSSRDNFTEPHCTSTNEKGCQTEPFWSGVKEEESEEEAESEEAQDSSSDSDTDWTEAKHPQDRTLTEDLNTVNPFSERKYIVFESKLQELLNQCRACSKPCHVLHH